MLLNWKSVKVEISFTYKMYFQKIHHIRIQSFSSLVRRRQQEKFFKANLSPLSLLFLLNSCRSISVTRFGEISSLWQNFKVLKFLNGLFSIWKSFAPTLANCHCCEWPKIEQ